MSMTKDTLALWNQIRKSGNSGLPPELTKAITQATGLVWFDLEQYAKLLFPVITPLRNELPRVKGDGGVATHWKSITGINITNVDIGLGEGQRGGTTTTQEVDNVATYKSFGLDDSVTFEADLAALNFDDVKQLSVDNLLRSTMIGEEKCILGGDASLALGTTATPSVADAGQNKGAVTGNTLVSVICVALTFDGYNRAGGSTVTPGTLVIQASITRTNTDGSTTTFGGGSAQKSAAASVTTANDSNNTHGVSASVTAKAGAIGYAWFWGGSGTETLGAVTTLNSYLITTNTGSGTQTAASMPSSDNSTNSFLFDGIITQIFTAGSNSTIITQPTGTAGTGTPLTSDGAGAIVEIDTALKAFWDSYRLSPQVMLVNSQELMNITKKVVAGGNAPLFRFNTDVANIGSAQMVSLTAGSVVGTYLNKFTMAGGQLLSVLLHPNVPPGLIIFYSRSLPYPLSNVKNLLQMKMRRDYYQIEWPIVKPQYEYSVWANGLLQNYFPPAFGAICNIANG